MNHDLIDDVLFRMEREDQGQRTAGMNRIERWRSIPRETGVFLYQMMMIQQPRVTVEIGTSHGYSTIWLGLAAKQFGGTVYTYEVEEWRHERAVANISEVGLQKTITTNLVSSEPEYPQDIGMAFIDAEKSDYMNHFNRLKAKLIPGALVLADNITSHPKELKAYTTLVRGDPDFVSNLIPIGKGIELTRKISSEEFLTPR